MALVRGRVAMRPDELEALARMVQGAGTYVEIGVLWGGSVVHAALANPDLVICAIDPMIGYYGHRDNDDNGNTPTEQAFWDNIYANGIGDRVQLVKSLSYPFPVGGVFDCGLIDGDHSAVWVRRDWDNLRTRCKRVAFHDVDDPAVMGVVQDALSDPGWHLVERTGNLMILEATDGC